MPEQDSAQARDDGMEDDISILDLLLVLARQKRIILRSLIFFGVLGLLVAVFSSSEYTSSATVIREVEDSGGATSSALDALRGFGFGVGGASTGLTADAYPDIVKSREVRLAVARSMFRFSGLSEELSLVEYLDQHPGFLARVSEYTIGLPGKLIRAVSGSSGDRAASPGLTLTREEEYAVEKISEMVRTSENLDSGLMTISVITKDPLLSVQVALSFVEELVGRVRDVYTEKSRQNLEFIQARFEEAEWELSIADSVLAQFEDGNVGVTSARLETERQRLQRQVTFKTQLYADLQTQLTQTEIELQRAEPVITVLEQPVAPLETSGPRRFLTLVLFLFLGGMVGVVLALVKTGVENSRADSESQGKLEEIAAAMPKWWKKRLI